MERLTIKAPSGLIHLKDNKEMTINVAIKKLSDYEDLEEHGLLLKLENKYEKVSIGTFVFAIEEKGIVGGRICYVSECWNDYQGFQGEYKFMLWDSKYRGNRKFKYSDFGKTVFLTQDEAKEALKTISGE